ncbi:MAG: hypothetical protein Q8Q51_11505 [Lutibacter sp.]|nr:hypothetical protein [Lutibacter sp.]
MKNIRENPLLEYEGVSEKVNKKTGELYYSNSYNYQNLMFTIYTDSNNNVTKMFIQGSVHYYFNNGLHNANDFSFMNFLYTIKDLKDKFGINPHMCVIRSLEYGVNIQHEYDTRLIMINVFYQKRKKFITPILKPYKQAGNPRNDDWITKIYDKGFQFPKYSNGELLRFELKYMRSRELNKLGIVFLSDLFIRENHFKLYKVLIKRFSEILIYDYTINSKKLTPTQSNNISDYSNPNYWETKMINIKKGSLSYDNFDYHKNRLKNIISKSSKNIQNNLMQSLVNKQFILLNINQYNGFEKQKDYPIYTSIENKKCTLYTHLYIGCMYPISFKYYINNTKPSINRICPITGVDISMQKGNSHLLSNTGLKYYEENKPIYYKMLVNTLLTGQENEFEKTIYDKLSKQIRNRFYNKRNNYNNNQLGLSI